MALPTSWQELTQKQLRAALSLMATGAAGKSLMTQAFLIFSGLKPEGEDIYRNRAGFLMKIGVNQIAAAALHLEYLTTPPTAAVRLDRAGDGTPCKTGADFEDATFGEFLHTDGLFLMYLNNPGANAYRLVEIAEMLYPGIGRAAANSRLMNANIIIWLTGLKKQLAGMYPYLFAAPAAGYEETPDETAARSRRATLSMIRALTGGDITKENDILQTAAHSALNELNEKAREAKELEKISKK
ncbi:MAG: hypothetical protein ACOCM7_01735 [Bacteroidales bacterium]